MALYKCSFSECRLQFTDISSFCSHVNRHTTKNEEEKIQQFTCPICPFNAKKSFLSCSKLKQHMETHRIRQNPNKNKFEIRKSLPGTSSSIHNNIVSITEDNDSSAIRNYDLILETPGNEIRNAGKIVELIEQMFL